MHRWEPPRWRAPLLLAGSGVLGFAAVDAPPVLAAAAVLLLLAIREVLVRPTLAADPDGLSYPHGWRHRWVPWSAVTGVRSRSERHWLAGGRVLEIDVREPGGEPADENLIVLAEARLGADPDEVVRVLQRLRSARSS